MSACAEDAVPARALPESGPSAALPAREAAVAGAIARITKATCDREESCNAVGPGATFGSRPACEGAVKVKYGRDLSTSMCPGGLDAEALGACLDSIEAGECSEPGDTVGRTGMCAIKSICIR